MITQMSLHRSSRNCFLAQLTVCDFSVDMCFKRKPYKLLKCTLFFSLDFYFNTQMGINTAFSDKFLTKDAFKSIP